MRAYKNINGLKFGKLTVIKETEKRETNGGIFCLCKCDCGKFKEIRKASLISGNTKSCGCAIVDKLKQKKIHYKHGDSKTRLHTIWCEMRRRCYNKNDSAFKNYGGRGITVCDNWANNYINFKNWALKNGYKDNLTIDRIDNNKGYSEDNCKWVNAKEQANNRRTNIKIMYKNKQYTLKQLSELLDIEYRKLYWRYKTKTTKQLGIEIKEV